MRRGLNVNVSSDVKPEYKAVICGPSWWRRWLLNSSTKTHGESKVWKFSSKVWSSITTFLLRFGNFLVLRMCQWRKLNTYIKIYLYRVVHEKPARRLVDQRGRRSRNLYRKINKCKCKVLNGQRSCWKWSPCTSIHFCVRCSILSYTRWNSAVSILRNDTAELHRVYDNMLQRAQKCIDVQGDHFQHLL